MKMLTGILYLAVSAFLTVTAQRPAKPCLLENRLQNSAACLSRIQSAIYSDSEFFFGRSLDALCDNTQQNNPDDLNCYTGDENSRSYSLASRLFGGQIKADRIDRYLRVTFSTQEGTYQACGGLHAIDKRVTDANPDMVPAKPVEVRNLSDFEMNVDNGTYYTILIMDVGYKFIHGLVVDYPESRTIIPYQAPLNFRNITNSYVFLVYKQPSKDYMLEPRIIGLMRSSSQASLFSVNMFSTIHELTGPVAVNWMLVANDPWAVQQVLNNSDVDYCVMYHMEALRLSPLEFMDKNFSTIDSYMRVVFNSAPINFTSCCAKIDLGATKVELSPIIGQSTDLVFVRSQPNISTDRSILRSTTNTRLYTIVGLDPDYPDSALATPSLPHLKSLAINTPEDSFHTLSTSSLFPYVEPLPLNSVNPRRLYFLLLEQSTIIDPQVVMNQTSANSCPSGQSGRCRFDVRRLVAENNLVLRGFNWVNVTNDAYGRKKMMDRGEKEGEVCNGFDVCGGAGLRPDPRSFKPKGANGADRLAAVASLVLSSMIFARWQFVGL